MSDILEHQGNEKQFDGDTVTGHFIQKQSIPKRLVKAVGANAKQGNLGRYHLNEANGETQTTDSHSATLSTTYSD
ncbi:hypothetical protein BD309DRAFT_988577 [Dichomitus squalens]|uniref:Uncharacterized protein n=1 Tax=Dichomitus squalens TaxID=114155 RepID=A0A4Q9P439_9APHY|nr:hypothetical protein BD311DRAFT_805343 [Dichomitus squalens]TBU46766.1 hypothetical protein BD309DRAFT_988577 [Dichomitus squalens]TBU60497.1 hypothetical protein BD310DRAFT_815094 [Dichomitus squalens]